MPLHGYSEDRSRNLPGFRKKHGNVKGVGQKRPRRLGIRKRAGRIVETAGSACNVQSQCTVALLGHEIDAIASLREFERQQTSVLEAKYARAGCPWNVDLSWARAGDGRLRRRRGCAGRDISKGEPAQGTVPGDVLFGG